MNDTIIKQWTYVSFHMPGAITLNAWNALSEHQRDVIREEIDELTKRRTKPIELPQPTP